MKSSASEEPQVHVQEIPKSAPQKEGERLTKDFRATIKGSGSPVDVGCAELRMPEKGINGSRDALLILNIDPGAPNMDMVAQVLIEIAKQKISSPDRQCMVIMYDGVASSEFAKRYEKFSEGIFLTR
ncbi:MAG: hypothetical protein Q7S11_02995 [bacterium]|nr:hypothetical protein [bacterium]